MASRRVGAPYAGSRPSLSPAGQAAPAEDRWVEPLLCVPALLRSFGVSFETVARNAGIPPSALDDPNGRVSFTDMGRLLVECASATDCPHFGLLVGQRSGLAAVGPTGILARHSASVRHALRVLMTHLHLHDRGAVLSLHPRSDREVELAYALHHADTPGARHIADGALASLMQALRTLSGPRWAPTEVTFACGQPKNTAAYRRCFGAPVRFNAARFAIAFRTNWLDRPIAGADPGERNRLATLVTQLERSRSASMTERSREALGRLLIAVPPSVDRVARVLGVSRRTLNRHLGHEGTSVKALLEEARFALAKQLLSETRMPVSDIAAALHYTTPGAFSRAFTRWTGGTNPRRFRTSACRRRPICGRK